MSAAKAPVVVIEQPNYLPWIGYFDLMAQADLWVWYDDVQFTKRDWRNRNRVARDGEPRWLTIPVRSKGRYEQRLDEVEIDPGPPWIRKHLQTLRSLYGGGEWFDEVFDFVRGSLERRHPRLVDLTIELNEAIGARLGMATRFVRSSTLSGVSGRGQERLIEVCGRFDAATYLSGPAARAYIDPGRFATAGIELRYIVYDYPPYDRGGHRFIPRLSIVDSLVWLGARETALYIERHARSEPASDSDAPANALTEVPGC